MNKTKIDWCDMTWNPISGCLHGCEYCYARKIAHRFGGASETHYNECVGEECQWVTEGTGKIHELDVSVYDVDRGHNAPYPFEFDPTLHRYRLNEPQKIKKPQRIFVVSMGDMFGDWVPDEWQLQIYIACGKAYWHQYLFLTKNPKAYSKVFYRSDMDYRHNFWLGTTVTDDDSFIWRGADLYQNTGHDNKRHAKRFLSIEPLLGKIDEHRLYTCIRYLDWVIVGQQTGSGAKPPKPEWVESIIEQCRAANVPVFVKSPLYKQFPIQEWPEGLK